jgi:hypothetical protein
MQFSNRTLLGKSPFRQGNRMKKSVFIGRPVAAMIRRRPGLGYRQAGAWEPGLGQHISYKKLHGIAL